MSNNPTATFDMICAIINPLLDGAANGTIEWTEAQYNANLRCEALGWTFEDFAAELSRRLDTAISA